MNKKGYAISQISLLILGIFAAVFIIGQTSFVSSTEGEECKVEGSQTGCDSGEVCKKGSNGKYTCKVQESSDSGSDSGNGAMDTLKKGTQALGTTTAVVTAPKQTKNLLKTIGLLKKEVAAGEAAIEQAAIETSLGETIAKNGAFKLFGNQIYWTKSAATEAATAEIAAVAPESSAYMFGEGAIASGGVLHGAAVVMSYAAIAAAAAVVAGLVANLVGASADQSEVVAYTAGASVFSGLIVASLTAGPAGWITGGVVAIIGVLGFYKKESTEIVKYQCLSYVPESGGDHCEECNDGNLPCTEYQCKSLGRACELVNKGTGDELCIHTSRGDIQPPQVSAWYETLYDDYNYNPLTTNFPEDRGVRVIKVGSDTDCVPPFEPVRFGITLDEPGICKYSQERMDSWEEMGSEYFSNGVSAYNHSMSMTFPDKAAVEAEGFEYQEGFNEFFVRCEDANGNINSANFVFRFCVDESPDLSTPTILATTPLRDSPIKFNTSEINSTFYLNKPSTCKWDYVDRTYDDMENEMSCVETTGEAVPYQYTMAYPCKTTFNGIANYVENDFYVKCKSYPQKNETERIVMENSFVYTLKGTRPLTIEEVYPNETLRGSAQVVNVELFAMTSGGSNEEGQSICYFSDSGEEGDYVRFDETNNYQHRQNLYLDAGAYNYHIKCVDQGGNIDESVAEFVIESDTTSPLIARAYSEDGFLKVVTNEESRCVYSTFGCDYSFDDGTLMSHDEYIDHFTPWDSTTNLYVKCEDVYGNRPLAQDECSIVIRAYDEFVDPNN